MSTTKDCIIDKVGIVESGWVGLGENNSIMVGFHTKETE